MTHNPPHPIDIRIGQNLRLLRTQKGMSQPTLAGRLGITFQQVQKYEKGTNRLSASRLWDCAQIFDVSPAAFFSSPGTALEVIPAAEIDRSLADWLNVYRRLDARPRKLVIELAQLLSEQPGE
jgi:transcriptional regulator with XRE-family HTH domain